MLVASLPFADQNDYLSARMRKAYAFLRETDLARLPLGRFDIDGEDVFANVQEYTTVPAADKQMEAHRRYYDVQFVVAGEELLQYAPLDGLTLVDTFDEVSDFGLYESPSTCSDTVLHAGDLAILAPEDAHKPGCALGGKSSQVRKIVVKVRA